MFLQSSSWRPGLAVALLALSFPLLSWQSQSEGQTSGPKPPPLTAKQKEKLKERDRLSLEIRKLHGQGKLGQAVSRIKKMMETKPIDQRIVYVKADNRVRYDNVVAVIDSIRSAGIDRVGLVVDPGKRGDTTPSSPTPQ